MKNFIFYIMLIVTVIRTGDIVYLLLHGNSNLPVGIILIYGLLALYGIFLIIKKFARAIFVHELRNFFFFDAIITIFSLIYIAVSIPLQLTILEILLVGTAVHVFIDICIVYYCQRQLKNRYIPVNVKDEHKNSDVGEAND